MILNREIIFKDISVIFFILSIACVPVLNGISSSISDYFLFKALLLSISLIFSFAYSRTIKFNDVDKLVCVYVFFSLLSFYWGDLNLSTFLTYFGLWVTYLMTYIITRNLELTWNPSFRLIVLTIIFELLIMMFVYEGNLALNGGYVVGHMSIVLLLLKRDLSKLQSFLTLPLFFFFSGLRFFIVALMTFVKNHKLILTVGTSSILLAYVLTNLFLDTEIYSLILGYRIAEPIYLLNSISNNFYDIVFGKGFGTDADSVLMGTKGVIEHYGVFHNFYFTIFYNNGLLGLILFLSIFLFIFYRYPKSAYLPSIAILLIMIAIDSHRDGIWPIFLILAFASNYETKNEKNTSFS